MCLHSVQTKRIGKLCKAEGVADVFLACVNNTLGSGLTPKRLRVVAFQITATGRYQRMAHNFLIFLNTLISCSICKQSCQFIGNTHLGLGRSEPTVGPPS